MSFATLVNLTVLPVSFSSFLGVREDDVSSAQPENAVAREVIAAFIAALMASAKCGICPVKSPSSTTKYSAFDLVSSLRSSAPLIV
ncbi:hypothetical protein D3C78_1342950 [compost metagenome]